MVLISVISCGLLQYSFISIDAATRLVSFVPLPSMSMTKYLMLPATEVQSFSVVGCWDGEEAAGANAKATDKPIATAAMGIIANTSLFLFLTVDTYSYSCFFYYLKDIVPTI
jgi:hypothetical protein